MGRIPDRGCKRSRNGIYLNPKEKNRSEDRYNKKKKKRGTGKKTEARKTVTSGGGAT